jgi:IS5 family transposase
VDRHGFIIAHHQYFSNISDVNTLPDALEGWQKTFGRPPGELGADRGFHHPKTSQEDLGTQDIAKLAIPYKGKRKHPESNTYWFKRLQRLRAIIEAIISHLKNDHRMGRCLYKGPEGDHINVSLATIAWNCKKWINMEGVLQAAG